MVNNILLSNGIRTTNIFGHRSKRVSPPMRVESKACLSAERCLGISAVDRGLMELQRADEHEGLAAYRESFVQSYQKRLKAYKEAQKTILAQAWRYRGAVLEPPMPPNALTAYTPDLYGLDDAKRDCRFEMIKIVREVGPLTKFAYGFN